MDACAAFAFVFSAESTKKYIGSRSLAQETQVCFVILYNISGSFSPSSSSFCFLLFSSPAITLIDLNTTPQKPAFHCHCQTTALQPTQALGPFVCDYYYFFNWIWNPFEVKSYALFFTSHVAKYI